MEKLRIDKWLWAARFYKTRSLASEEILRGRVQVNGLAVKPAREIKAGDTLQLRVGATLRTVLVQALSDKRGPAPVAATLFMETQESIANRVAAAEQRRLAPEPALSIADGRPTKRERRITDKARDQQIYDWDSRWSASIDGS